MKLKLRLYRAHDIDLIVLAKTGTVNIPDEARNAIISYFMGDNTRPNLTMKEIPEGITVDNIMQRSETDRKQKCMVFTVTVSNKDAPGIEALIQGLRKGYRNCLIKSMLRIYLSIIPDKILAQLFDAAAASDKPIEETPDVRYNYGNRNDAYPQEGVNTRPEKQIAESLEAASEEELDPTSIMLNM